jgi:hypothetical protein
MIRSAVEDKNRFGDAWPLALCLLVVGFGALPLVSEAAAGDRFEEIGEIGDVGARDRGDGESDPGWIDDPPNLEGTTHTWPVQASPAASRESSQRLLEVESRGAVEAYLETLLGVSPIPPEILPDDAWLRAKLKGSARFESQDESGEETSYRSAALLRFEPQDRQRFRGQYESIEVRRRVWRVGGGAVLAVIMSWAALTAASLAVRRIEKGRPALASRAAGDR